LVKNRLFALAGRWEDKEKERTAGGRLEIDLFYGFPKE
jgi:hypothetical protein